MSRAQEQESSLREHSSACYQIPSKMWNELADPRQKFNGYSCEVW